MFKSLFLKMHGKINSYKVLFLTWEIGSFISYKRVSSSVISIVWFPALSIL